LRTVPEIRRETLRPLWGTVRGPLRQSRGLLFGAIGAMFGFAISKALTAFPLKLLFDRFEGKPAPAGLPLPEDPEEFVALLAVALVVFYGLKGWCFYQQEVLTAKTGRRVVLTIRSTLFRKILELPAAFHARRKTGDLLARVIADVNQIKELVLGVGLDVVADSLAFLVQVAILFLIDPVLAGAAVLVIPFLFLGTMRFSRSVSTAAREQRRKQGELAASLNEMLRSIRVLQAFGRSDLQQGAFDQRDVESLRAEVRMRRLQANLVRVVEMGVAVGSALVVWIGARKVFGRDLTSGDLVLFTTYLRSMYRPIQDLARLSSRFSKAVASAERIGEVLAAPNPIADPPDPVPLVRARGAIEFRDVSFEYEEGRPALEGVSFAVEPGECVALFGPSGAGKSTLTTLLLRFYDPTSGSILLDGHDLRRYRVAELRRQIAVVFQEPFLFGVSVRENIAFGKPDATEEEIHAAAKAAQAHEFIERLPQGYDTVLGEHGASLSGGQRQRVAIARAFVRDAPVLLLDEPMTGLDPRKEGEVRAALRALMKGRTTILVAHNLRAIPKADRIVVLERGRLRAIGTFEELAGRVEGLRGALPLESHARIPRASEAS
jgi:ATP-binding cassette subfamily B protein